MAARTREQDERQIRFVEMVQSLMQPGALPASPDGAEDQTPPTLVQTHASTVILTGAFAYKLKKPNDFGFFDYSTPEQRRHFCAQEVLLNRRLAPEIYKGVAPILRDQRGRYALGQTMAPDDVPVPGALVEGATVADYAVVMSRLPEDETLATRIANGTVTLASMDVLASHLAAFHAASQTDEQIAQFGSVGVVGGNWTENFDQMRPYIGRTLDEATFAQIERFVAGFLHSRRPLFEARMDGDRVRDCHGDLRLQHIYFAPGVAQAGDRNVPSEPPAVVDCIEFNDRFRYSDVASELAFLTMELDAAGRADLARRFLRAYVDETGDSAIRELLPFYACYRACVRGKVLSFQLDQPEVSEAQRNEVQREAFELFALAARYASAPARPRIALIGGLMGVGKSTLAERIAGETGWLVLSSDVVRKQLSSGPDDPKYRAAFGEGAYTSSWNAATYRALLATGEEVVRGGRSVLVDASFMRRENRLAFAEMAAGIGATCVFIECECDAETALLRLAERSYAANLNAHDRSDPLTASDGRVELYAAQRERWEPFAATEADSDLTHLKVNTGTSLSEQLAAVLASLGGSDDVCWLA